MSEAVGQVGEGARGSSGRAAGCTGSTRSSRPTSTSAPFFVVFCAFGLFPLGYTAWMSLTDRNLLDPTTHFVGLDNYTALLHDSYFWNAVENTLGIWVLSTDSPAAARARPRLCAEHGLRGRTFFRMSVLLPQVTSVVAVALIFTQLFSRDYGLFNWHARRHRDRADQLGGGPVLVVDRALGDGHLALDGLQRAALPGRDAGDPRRPVRVGGDRRRPALEAVLAHHRAHDPADDHLHGHHLDDRRAPALHRAVPVPADQERRDRRLRRGSTRRSRCTCTRSRSAARSSSSATPPRSPGACS